MHKRKVAGILQYGNRLNYTKKITKFQEGGHVAVSQGYDWREDPYELMLLQQKAAKDNAKLRYSAKNATKEKEQKPVKSILGEFDSIKGGLDGSRKAAQQVADGMIQGFYDKLDKNGREWLYSDAASMEFYKIQTGISSLTEQIKSEKIEFDKLRDGISEDSLSAKAISTSGDAFGFAKDSNGKESPAVIPMTKYYANPDAFKIGTLSELIDWKASQDVSGNNKIVATFLGDNALGDNDLRDMYIKDREEVQFKIDKGMVIATADHASVNAGEEVGSVDQVLANIKGVLSGKAVVNPNMATDELKILKDVINDVTISVYRSEIANNTRLRSSLLSQAVQDSRVMDHLKELPQEQRAAYMDKAIGALWIEKIISKNYPSKDGSTNSDGSPKITAKVDQAGGAYASMFDSAYKEQFTQGAILNISDGAVSKVYEYGDSKDENILRMAAIKFPARTGVLEPIVFSNADAKGEEKEQNFASRNNMIKNNLDVDRTYTLDGTPLDDVMPGGQNAKDFLNESALIEPGSKVDFVALPTDSDGKPIHAETYWVNVLKVKTRHDYIKAYKAVTGKEPKFKAEDLVAGSSHDKDYNAYKEWIQSGTNVASAEAFYKAENKKSPNHKDTIAAKRAWDMAKLAEKSVHEATKSFKDKSAQYGGVTMRLFGIYTVNYDDAWTNDGLNKAVVKAAKSRKFGSGGVRPNTSTTAKNNIVNINEVDRAINFEDIQSLKLLAPVRSMADRLAAGEDQNWTNRSEVEKIERELTTGLNSLGALSNPKVKNIVHLLF